MRTFLFHLAFLFCLCFTCIAQDTLAQGAGQNKNKFIRKLQKTIWTVGLSGTVIDDDARAFKNVFDVNNAWSFLYFPSKINFEGSVQNGLSVEGAFTYSRLKKGKLIGEENYARPDNVNLIAFDVNAKFFPTDLTGGAGAFSPYAAGGFGYTYRSYPERKSAITGNFGFGLNIWLVKGFGINVQSMAKFALNNAYGKNYLQHSLGLVYRFNLLTGSKMPNKPGKRYNLFRNL